MKNPGRTPKKIQIEEDEKDDNPKKDESYIHFILYQ